MPFVNVKFSYINNSGKLVELIVNNCTLNNPYSSLYLLKTNIIRLEFVEMLNSILQNSNNNIDNYKTIVASFLSKYNMVDPITEDVKDQVSIAVSKLEYYNKWGKNYIYSLSSANKQQRCNNFKDKSIAKFGGELFNEQRDIADEIFSNMSAPIPSRHVVNADGKKAVDPLTFRMSSYNNATSGCFHENSFVYLKDGSTKKCSEVVKGDEIFTGYSINDDSKLYAKIVCVIKNDCKDNICQMCCFDSGLMITPWHPIYYNTWEFPSKIIKEEDVECSIMYNFILDNYHTVIVNDIMCVTLGHNISNNAVTYHPYYGTNLVIDDLKQMLGYDSGVLHFKYNNIIKSDNGNIIGYNKDSLYVYVNI